MNNNEHKIKCRIEELEQYIDELESKLCDYNDVIAQIHSIQESMSTSIVSLDSMKNKQTDMFNELICSHDELSHNYIKQEEKLRYIQEENDCLRCENDQLNDELNEQEVILEKIETIRSNLTEETENQQKQLSGIIEITKNFQDSQIDLELELKDKNQDIIHLQGAIAEKITLHSQLEKQVNVKKEKNEKLFSLINELKKENEKKIRILQTELLKLQGKLNEKLGELTTINCNFKNKREELESQKNQIKKIKKAMKELPELNVKDKEKTDKKISELRTEVKSMRSDIMHINQKLSDAQTENNKLKRQLEDKDKATKLLMSTNEQLQQEVGRIKETAELTTKMLTAEREQQAGKKKIFERKLALKVQEECELKQLIKKQREQIQQTKKEICRKSVPSKILPTSKTCTAKTISDNEPSTDLCKSSKTDSI